MSDNRNYSVITNFGCHWQCPYCIVRNTGIQIAETRMGATYDTVMDLADSGKMKFLSFSGGGDPLGGLIFAVPTGMRRSPGACTSTTSKPKCTPVCQAWLSECTTWRPQSSFRESSTICGTST